MRLEGKVCIVTGASSGMGKSIVELFVKEGAKVVAVARRKERLEELAASLKNLEGEVVVCVGDVSKEEDNDRAINMALEYFGGLDVLVNNAGIMDDMSPIGDITNEKMEQVFKVNTFGPMMAMRKAVSVFKENGNGGNIINVASVGAQRSVAGAIYCASKAAIVAASKNTAFMYMPDKIRCNVIAPGGIATEISTSMGQPNPNGYARCAKLFAAAPETGTGEDIAKAALFLASDESNYISGDVLVVDGGWIAG